MTGVQTCALPISGASLESRAFVEHFAEQGIESIIMSPFKVDNKFGIQLALEYEKVIRESQDAHPTIEGLFRQAKYRTIEKLKADGNYEDMALEFQILGNPKLTMCEKR